jgi:hypothetical protein
MRLKFLKFERDRNAAENYQIVINESEKLQNLTKRRRLLFNINYYSLTFVKFHSQIFASILITAIKRVRI